MHAVAGVKKKDGVPVLAKVAADFAADQAGLTHARDHHLAATFAAAISHRLNEIVIEPIDYGNNTIGFDAQHIGGALENIPVFHCRKFFFHQGVDLFDNRSRPSKSFKSSEFGPSLFA